MPMRSSSDHVFPKKFFPLENCLKTPSKMICSIQTHLSMVTRR